VPARGADSVGRLAAAFNGMAEHLQQLLAIQRELVRAVSHELRTPVARLRFGLEMIGGHHPEAREKYLEGMDTTSRISTDWSTKCSPTQAWSRARRR
jgi:two-component system sensor histidine kinase RstB